MIELDPFNDGPLLLSMGLPAFSLLLHLFFDDFFQPLVGFLFLLVELFNVVAELLELVEVLHEVQFLDGSRGTSSAA